MEGHVASNDTSNAHNETACPTVVVRFSLLGHNRGLPGSTSRVGKMRGRVQVNASAEKHTLVMYFPTDNATANQRSTIVIQLYKPAFLNRGSAQP